MGSDILASVLVRAGGGGGACSSSLGPFCASVPLLVTGALPCGVTMPTEGGPGAEVLCQRQSRPRAINSEDGSAAAPAQPGRRKTSGIVGVRSRSASDATCTDGPPRIQHEPYFTAQNKTTLFQEEACPKLVQSGPHLTEAGGGARGGESRVADLVQTAATSVRGT